MLHIKGGVVTYTWNPLSRCCYVHVHRRFPSDLCLILFNLDTWNYEFADLQIPINLSQNQSQSTLFFWDLLFGGLPHSPLIVSWMIWFYYWNSTLYMYIWNEYFNYNNFYNYRWSDKLLVIFSIFLIYLQCLSYKTLIAFREWTIPQMENVYY